MGLCNFSHAPRTPIVIISIRMQYNMVDFSEAQHFSHVFFSISLINNDEISNFLFLPLTHCIWSPLSFQTVTTIFVSFPNKTFGYCSGCNDLQLRAPFRTERHTPLLLKVLPVASPPIKLPSAGEYHSRSCPFKCISLVDAAVCICPAPSPSIEMLLRSCPRSYVPGGLNRCF